MMQTGENIKERRIELVWLDSIKAIALIWIFLVHATEQIFGGPYIANPWTNWPPFIARLAQLRPLEGYGFWNIPLNIIRYVGWGGDHGVQLFLIVSGFGLTWGLLARHGKTPLSLIPFYRRRVERVYPLWWGAHLLFLCGAFFLSGWDLRLTDPRFYLSLVGLRLGPDTLYYFSPAWWYIALLIQLYLIYPVLWEGLRRQGPLRLLLISCILAFPIRAAGLLYFSEYLDAWSRGAIFITRLPEFVFGVSLAAWMYYEPAQTDRWLRAPVTLVVAGLSCILGIILALTLVGMTAALFLIGIGVFILLYALLGGDNPKIKLGSWWGWIGQHSYSLYLVHHPFILLLVPIGLSSVRQALIGPIAALILTFIVAVFLERGVDKITLTLRKASQQGRLKSLVFRGVALLVLMIALLLSGEFLVRWLVPGEILGWGERISLEPDSAFGWRLKPYTETRLRWESYDYWVKANSLGFPGPEYLEQKTPGTFRILTVGDAFTSAEGVDTNQAWPRLLETDLAAQLPDRPIQVMNFGITGYGPNQYAAVIEKFAPIYQPDLIIIGFFVNDYQDVLLTNEQFRTSIGFGLPDQDSLYTILRLMQLRRFVSLHLIEPLKELIRGTPHPNGYFLGQFGALERNRPDIEVTGRQQATARLEQIKTVADRVGARVVIVMIPAPVQVCKSGQLAYYPRNVDIADSSRFDLDLPQRMTKEVTDSLNFAFYDLRPVLRSAADCPYQPRNLHWTVEGHRLVAEYLTGVLKTDTVNLSQQGALFE